MKTYYIEFNSYKDGVTIHSLEKEIEASDIYGAMEEVENYCFDNNSTCEITNVRKIDKNTFTCESCRRKYLFASPCTPDDCKSRYEEACTYDKENNAEQKK